jgi:energy-coupling factor transport system permease protein
MEARGLTPGAPRTVIAAPRFHRRDIAFVVSALAVLALCISWSIRADA